MPELYAAVPARAVPTATLRAARAMARRVRQDLQLGRSVRLRWFRRVEPGEKQATVRRVMRELRHPDDFADLVVAAMDDRLRAAFQACPVEAAELERFAEGLEECARLATELAARGAGWMASRDPMNGCVLVDRPCIAWISADLPPELVRRTVAHELRHAWWFGRAGALLSSRFEQLRPWMEADANAYAAHALASLPNSPAPGVAVVPMCADLPHVRQRPGTPLLDPGGVPCA